MNTALIGWSPKTVYTWVRRGNGAFLFQLSSPKLSLFLSFTSYLCTNITQVPWEATENNTWNVKKWNCKISPLPSGATHTSSKPSSRLPCAPRNSKCIEGLLRFVTTNGIIPDHVREVRGFTRSRFIFSSVSISLAWQSAVTLSWYVRQRSTRYTSRLCRYCRIPFNMLQGLTQVYRIRWINWDCYNPCS